MDNALREKFEAILTDAAGTPISTHELASTLADAALAVIEKEQALQSVKVKPLEWEQNGDYIHADGVCGGYGINLWRSNATGEVVRIEMDGERHANVKLAKRAADDDNRARILSAVEPAPASVAEAAREIIAALDNEILASTVSAKAGVVLRGDVPPSCEVTDSEIIGAFTSALRALADGEVE